MNFIPDSGKYEIVSFVCTCTGDRVYKNTPLQRVALEVAGWTSEVDAMEAGEMWNRGLLPLRPVILSSHGLVAREMPTDADPRIGSPRLAPIGVCTMTHQELIDMHRGYHEQD